MTSRFRRCTRRRTAAPGDDLQEAPEIAIDLAPVAAFLFARHRLRGKLSGASPRYQVRAVRGTAQVPTTPPSRRRMATVAERGRPPSGRIRRPCWPRTSIRAYQRTW